MRLYNKVWKYDLITARFIRPRRRPHHVGQRQFSVKTLCCYRIPVSIQVDGALRGGGKGGGPFDHGGLREERVYLTLRFVQSALWWMEGRVAESGRRIWRNKSEKCIKLSNIACGHCIINIHLYIKMYNRLTRHVVNPGGTDVWRRFVFNLLAVRVGSDVQCGFLLCHSCWETSTTRPLLNKPALQHRASWTKHCTRTDTDDYY